MGLKQFMIDHMPKVKVAVYQLKKLLHQHIPVLYKRICSFDISIELFCIQWILTLFSYDMELSQIKKMWDLLLSFGWKVFFRVAIELIDENKHIFEKLDYEELISSFKMFIKEGSYHADMLEKAMKLKITNKQLEELEQNYYRKHVDDTLITESFDQSRCHIFSSSMDEQENRNVIRQSLLRKTMNSIIETQGKISSVIKGIGEETAINKPLETNHYPLLELPMSKLDNKAIVLTDRGSKKECNLTQESAGRRNMDHRRKNTYDSGENIRSFKRQPSKENEKYHFKK
jgi:hypothetical protein